MTAKEPVSPILAAALVAAGGIMLLGAWMVGSALLHGYVLLRLWTWFIVPLGLPAIGWPHAIGIVLFGRLATTMIQGQPKEKEPNGWLLVILFPLLTLAEGYVVHWFMVR